MANANLSATLNVTSRDITMYYEPYEFLALQPALSILLITTLVIASIVGSSGNIFILIAIATQRDLHTVESIFIANLACSDLYVTLIADPLSIVAKTLGWRFFSDFPGLCRAVGSICTISCVSSLMTLSAMSCNRYVLICHRHLYPRLFTIRNSVIMCCCFYFIGFFLVVLNFFGIGDHSFDHKSLECFWDRMADHNYTIVFSVVVILIPITVTGLSYIRLYLHVRQSRLKVDSHSKVNPKPEVSTNATPTKPAVGDVQRKESTSGNDETAGIQLKNFKDESNGRQDIQSEQPDLAREKDDPKKTRLGANGSPKENGQCTHNGARIATEKQQNPKSKAAGGKMNPTLKLARALFIIYLVFSACWLPFSLLIALDADDTFSQELHVTVVVWAHLHPSINWLVYYLTNQKFHAAFRKLLRLNKCCT